MEKLLSVRYNDFVSVEEGREFTRMKERIGPSKEQASRMGGSEARKRLRAGRVIRLVGSQGS